MSDSILPNSALPSSEDSGGSARPRGRRIDRYFKAMTKAKASDMHLKADTAAKFRIRGDIHHVETSTLTNENIETMMFELMDERQRAVYAQKGSVDFAYHLEGGDRFRINVFRQRGKTSVAARRVPREIRTYRELNLPDAVGELAKLHQGLVLFAGITGSGKSTSIAAVLEQINLSRACHIMTLEDPIEFLYDDKKAFINQREIGLDVENFSEALKYVLREDPDVILIGELHDQNTFAAALSAAETGHLVFATIHASSAAATIGRMLDLYSEDARPQIRLLLSLTLQAVVCLKLLPGIRPESPRLPCCEIMLANASVRKLILEERDGEIGAVIRNSYHEGMIDFTESLRRLAEQELIAVKTAYAMAPNPDELKMRLKGISVTGGGIIG